MKSALRSKFSDNRPEKRAPYRIITGQVPEDFDPEFDRVIGPWCFAGAESVYPEWEELSYPKPFQDIREIKVWDDNLAMLSETIIAEKVSQLNNRHEVNYSGKFWYILLVQWVHEVCQLVFYRYREAAYFLKAKDIEGFSLSIPMPAAPCNFSGQADFYDRGVTNVHFNGYVSALLIAAMARKKLNVCEYVLENRALGISCAEEQDISILKRINRTLFAKLKGGRADFGGIICEYDLASKVRSGFMHMAMNMALEYFVPRHKDIRVAQPQPYLGIKEKFPRPFLEVLERVFEASLPTSLDTDFARLNSIAMNTKVKPGRLNVRTVAFYLNNTLLFSMAHKVEGGEGLIFVQHGSNYGTANAHSLAHLVEYSQHGFISWGWERHGNHKGRFLALPSPQLSIWRKSYRNSSIKLLMVAGAVDLLPSRLCSLGSIFCETRRRKDRHAFISAMGPHLFEKLVYRPAHPLPYTAEDTEFMKQSFPNMVQCHELRKFYQHLRSARLLVLDHPGTTLYMAVAAGVPFICFWPDDQWPMNSDAQPYFAKLRDAGVLFDSPQLALKEIDQIWERVEEWWDSPDIVEAVTGVRHIYARTSRFWFFMWINSLWRFKW